MVLTFDIERPVTAAPLYPAGLPAAAAAVRGIAAERALEADRDRRLPSPVTDSLVQAGFARHFVPLRHGGTAGGFLDLLRAAAEVAEGCPSASWCGSLFAAHGRLASYLPREAQDDVWAHSPDTVIAAAVMQPRLVAEPVRNGWLLSGSWGPASGVDHAEWMLVSALTGDGDGPGGRLFLLPRAEGRIEETWNTPGMRGTGSNTLVLDRVFVPEYRTVPRARLLSWERPVGGARCHGVPYPLVAALIFAGPVLGAARAVVSGWRSSATERLLAGEAADAEPGSSPEQLFARSTGELQAATLLLENAARLADTPEVESALAAADNARDCTLAVELCVSAAARLAAHPLAASAAEGGAGASAAARLQQAAQDVKVASSHVMLRFAPAVTGYAAVALRRTEG